MSSSQTPTSPTARAKHKEIRAEAKRNSRISYLTVAIIVIVLGSCVGFLGGLLAISYPTDWPLAQKIITAQQSSVPEVVFVERGDASSDTKLIELLQAHQSKTIISIYPGATQSYTTDNELGKGAIISADGWLVTLTDVIGNQNSISIVLDDGQVFVSDKFAEDPYSGMTFVKIKASQLPVADFRTTDVALGESIMFFTGSALNGDYVKFGHVENNHFSNTVELVTNRSNYYYLSDIDANEKYLGSPVFDERGSVMGFYAGEQLVIPASVVSSGIYSVFTNDEVERHQLSFIYQPLYRIIDPDRSSMTKGAKISSLGYQVGELAVGDVILKVDGVIVDETHDLSDLLSEIEIGTVVELRVERDDKMLDVEIVIE